MNRAAPVDEDAPTRHSAPDRAAAVPDAGVVPDVGPMLPDAKVVAPDASAVVSLDGGGMEAGTNGLIEWFDQRWVLGVSKPYRPRLPAPVTDWARPYDYAHGTFHIRITVNSKPTDAPVWLEVIFWRGSTHHCLICTDPLALKKPGTYTCSLPVKSAWGSIKTPTGVSLGWRCASPPVFDRPFDKIEVSAKLPDARGERNPAKELLDPHVPLDVRMSVVLVPAGKAH